MDKSAMSYKGAGQKALQWLGLYERVKGSRLYDIYWSLVNPQVIDDRNREIAFYIQTLEGLKNGDLIFDIGATRVSKRTYF